MPRILTHNWPWKLGSLILAVLLWFVVVGDAERPSIREVPVEIRLSGIPAQGFRIAGGQASPDRVKLSGPKSRLEAITSAQTDYVSVAGRSAPLEAVVSTSVADPRVTLESPVIVTVKITIEKGSNPLGE